MDQIKTEQPQIVVYILTSDTGDLSQARTTGKLFEDDMFDVRVMNIETPKDLKDKDKDLKELYKMKWCLNNAREENESRPLIITKDSSTSDLSSKQIADVISGMMEVDDYDLIYLCRWMDRCDMYSDMRPIFGTSSILAKTVSPNGTQSILYSPQGRDRVLGKIPMKNGKRFDTDGRSLDKALNDEIRKGNMDARCAVSNIIKYDITTSETDGDFDKLSDCIPKGLKSYQELVNRVNQIANNQNTNPSVNKKSNQSVNWVWIIIVLAIIFLIIWVIMRKSKTRRSI